MKPTVAHLFSVTGSGTLWQVHIDDAFRHSCKNKLHTYQITLLSQAKERSSRARFARCEQREIFMGTIFRLFPSGPWYSREGIRDCSTVWGIFCWQAPLTWGTLFYLTDVKNKRVCIITFYRSVIWSNSC